GNVTGCPKGCGTPRRKRHEKISMNTADIIGFLAAFICAVSMTPQVIKIYHTKKTADLSLGAFGTLASGLFLWFIYGILIHSIPIITGNAIGLSFTLYIIIMKLRQQG
ncbi:MAG: SemiSWEET transporter, partial [Thermodesulfobacteriota bacterium]|nr:SemiSWEET transporter [Thermodesulfobacteriota bacterium]